ncbi:hemerythrin domain-containing protein [Gaoshiqia sediminis]|uniref:Hemerythrin-like domain-containing protein n=1 Tax=Gaoshiqia sediminis TaxID=2986998 RepID=A0AA42C4Z7_9BACT|nr:hemerythrin domain-containing protein [Gaoshiqia sediminis]MCW0482298.1 hypothetical protein [Gaoshiqia sediminis]
MEINNFIEEFRNDHVFMRNLLLQMTEACLKKDKKKATASLNQLNAFAGPHYRFEEEVLFKELLPVLGSEYIHKLFTDHDFVIARIHRLIEIFTSDYLAEPDFEEGIVLLQSLQLQLIECESICPKMKSFGMKKSLRLLEVMNEIRMKSKDLTSWAESERNREKLKI